jgi:excisionase family DNA binding protein
VSRHNHPTNQWIRDNDRTETGTTGGTTISVTEAAARLNVTSQTIRNWVRAGRLTRNQTGKTFRIDPAELVGLEAMRRETRVIESVETRGM